MKSLVTEWNAGLYDEKHAFVFKYGEDLIQLLQPKSGEYIVDAGCGTGYLTNLIAEEGANVLGIDSSPEMIDKAKQVYPHIRFKVMNITDFALSQKADAVFSNAVLHWVHDKEKAIEQIYANLKPGGRFVLEMGGKNNVKGIVDALKETLDKFDYGLNAKKTVWYFPSIGEYTSLLENAGFRVLYATHYDRETELKDNSDGIGDWIKMFGGSFLKGINETELNDITADVQRRLKPTHFRNGKWYADYKRLRVLAVKEKN